MLAGDGAFVRVAAALAVAARVMRRGGCVMSRRLFASASRDHATACCLEGRGRPGAAALRRVYRACLGSGAMPPAGAAGLLTPLRNCSVTARPATETAAEAGFITRPCR